MFVRLTDSDIGGSYIDILDDDIFVYLYVHRGDQEEEIACPWDYDLSFTAAMHGHLPIGRYADLVQLILILPGLSDCMKYG